MTKGLSLNMFSLNTYFVKSEVIELIVFSKSISTEILAKAPTTILLEVITGLALTLRRKAGPKDNLAAL